MSTPAAEPSPPKPRHESRPSLNYRFPATAKNDVAPKRYISPLRHELGDDTEYSGGLLKRVRESAGASVEDLAELTKISKRYVRAIENNQFELLPAAVYVRGFVAEYAKALGLDPNKVASSFMTLYRRYKESDK